MTNLTLNSEVFEKESQKSTLNTNADTMTLSGTINKTIILFIIVAFVGLMTGKYILIGTAVSVYMPILIGITILHIFLAFMIYKNPKQASSLSILYAITEGVIIGMFSLFFETMYPGIVIQAVMLTFAVFTGMLLIYKTNIIEVDANFIAGITAAIMGTVLFYGIHFLIVLFGGNGFWMVWSNSGWGIGFSIFMIGLAAFNLVIDFHFIQESVEKRVPKYMEWYGAFGLIVTLVWLYIEVLRLLSKFQSRD